MKDVLLMGCMIAIFGFGYIVMGKLDQLLDGMAKSGDKGKGPDGYQGGREERVEGWERMRKGS